MKELYSHWLSPSEREKIVDVREPVEYQRGHVPGSLNIPLATLAQRIEEIQNLPKVYVYCHMGVRSLTAEHILRSAGLKNVVAVAQSGMADWIAAGYPIDRG